MPSATRGSCARSASASTGSPARPRGSRSSGSASGSSPSTTTTSRCSRSWDGRRRYANLRKLARLARSYEELRGPDVEGFVRFVREQEAVGARELEAVAEEEGGDAVRLLTIHAAKGLEFKVVVVADAGRDTAPPAAEEILALPDGRFGFRVADPVTGEAPRRVRRTRRCARPREAEERRAAAPLLRRDDARDRPADRLRLDRPRERPSDRTTPIGWVLERLDAHAELERRRA